MDYKNLQKNPLFQKFPEEELKKLAAKMQRNEIPAGNILFKEGDNGDLFYVIAEGELEVIKAMDTKNERLIAIREKGNFIGELSLINPNGIRMATVRSKSDAVLWQLSRRDFEETVQKSGILAYKILQELSQRLTAAHENSIQDLQEKNRELTIAYQNLKDAQEQIIEKEKLERELHVAQHIQKSILPREIPQTESISISCYLKPARAVGGDFYDVFKLDDNNIAVMIGDVTDKGIAAALVMAQTHALMYAEAIKHRDPAQVLYQANQNILRINQSGLFITAIYGIISTSTKEFYYARAGHEIPLIQYRGQKPEPVRMETGQPLGLFEEPIFDLQKINLGDGTRMLLYTDGVTDLLNPNQEQYKLDKLISDFYENKSNNAEQFCQNVHHNLITFQGKADQYDDITIIGIQTTI